VLDLVGIRGFTPVLPDERVGFGMVTLENARGGDAFAQDRRTGGAVNDIAEERVGIIDVPALGGQAGAVRERVFGEVLIEQLVGFGAGLPAAHALHRDGPGVLDPAADIDVMDEPVHDETAVEPGETTVVGNLKGELFHAGLPRAQPHRTMHSVGPGGDHVANRSLWICSTACSSGG
jgi:hypothetical protein